MTCGATHQDKVNTYFCGLEDPNHKGLHRHESADGELVFMWPRKKTLDQAVNDLALQARKLSSELDQVYAWADGPRSATEEQIQRLSNIVLAIGLMMDELNTVYVRTKNGEGSKS